MLFRGATVQSERAAERLYPFFFGLVYPFGIPFVVATHGKLPPVRRTMGTEGAKVMLYSVLDNKDYTATAITRNKSLPHMQNYPSCRLINCWPHETPCEEMTL